jgi:exopolysaccharide biosynthesis polyprenyl glycosylphosphotransferase
VKQAARAHPEDTGDVAVPSAPEHGDPPFLLAPGRAPPPETGQWSSHGFWAWMIVLPVDVVALMAPAVAYPRYTGAFLLMTGLVLWLSYSGGRHRAKLHLSVLDELPYMLGRLLAVIAVVGLTLSFAPQDVDPSGGLPPIDAATGFLRLALPAAALFVLGRFATTAIVLWARRRALIARRTVIVGGGVRAAELATLLRRYPRYGLEVVGFVDDGARCEASPVARHLGAVSSLGPLVAVYSATVLLIADGSVDEGELQAIVRTPACGSCDLLVVPRMQAFQTRAGQADHIGSVPIMGVRKLYLSGAAWTLKRVFGTVGALAGLVLLSPVFAACALAVRIDGGPGVLFHQQRVGRDGRLFDCLKFRSMRPANAEESSTQWSIAQDDRVRPVGRFLRRTSLDELPQLWNVLRGDMALVGPRPERPHFVEEFSEQYGCYAQRHRVRAGLTGLAQVSGLRGDTPIADRTGLDNYYIENWSIWLDIKVLLRTVGEVLRAGGR